MEHFIVLLIFIVLLLIFFINIVISEWDYISSVTSSLDRVRTVEKLTHRTANNPAPKYNYDKNFHKFPSYMIVDTVHIFKAEVVVFEHLGLDGKKRGKKKQKGSPND